MTLHNIAASDFTPPGLTGQGGTMSDPLKPVQTYVRLPTELSERIDKLAERLERSGSWVIRRCVEEYLPALEQEIESPTHVLRERPKDNRYPPIRRQKSK